MEPCSPPSTKESFVHFLLLLGRALLGSCAVPSPPAVPVLVTQLDSATWRSQPSLMTPTTRLLPSARLPPDISRALLLTHVPFGSTSRGKHRQGNASQLSLLWEEENVALGDGNAGGLPVFQPPLSSQCQQQPTPLSTYSILREGAQPESLNKDCHHFREGGLMVQAQLILPSALSLVCSHVLDSPTGCGCIRASTSPHDMRGKPQLLPVTMHSCPSQGDKQLRFPGSQGV